MDNIYITGLDENQLDELLAYAPDYSSRNAENIREKLMKKIAVKRKPAKRILLAAAAVVIMLALSLTALAATGVLDFGRFYESIFANPEASPYIVTGEGISIIEENNTNAVLHNEDIINNDGNGSDLTIEPVAAFIDGWQIYIQIKVTVLNDVPLPDTLYIYDGNTWINYGETTVSRLDEASAVISFMTLGNHVTYFKDGSPVYYHTPEWEQADTVTLTIDAVSSSPIRDMDVLGPSEEEYVIYNGQWELSISIDNETVSRIDPGFIKTDYMGLDTTVTVHATSITISIYAGEGTPFIMKEIYSIEDLLNDTYYEDNGLPVPSKQERTGDVVITLIDGRKVEPLVESLSNDDMQACYSYSMEFINPEDILSVLFFGVELIK